VGRPAAWGAGGRARTGYAFNSARATPRDDDVPVPAGRAQRPARRGPGVHETEHPRKDPARWRPPGARYAVQL